MSRVEKLRTMLGAAWRRTKWATSWVVAWLVWGAKLLGWAVGKFLATFWRLLEAMDSSLWRATKVIAAALWLWLCRAGAWSMAALQSFLAWLPTRWGRAYSAFAGGVLLVSTLWIIDELRAPPVLAAGSSAQIRAPIDEDDPILARIEGRYVHLSEIETIARAEGFLDDGEVLTSQSAFARGLVEQYVEQRLLARAALEEGLQRSPSVSRQVALARDRVLASSFIDARIEEEVTPERVREVFENQSLRLADEVKARHILVDSEDLAKEAAARIAAGEAFEALVPEYSTDRYTSKIEGELGWFTRNMMAPPIARAAFATKIDEVSAPFKSEFGWHLIKVTGRRGAANIPFERVRANIEEYLRLHTIDGTLDHLADQSQVVYFRPQSGDAQSPSVKENAAEIGSATPGIVQAPTRAAAHARQSASPIAPRAGQIANQLRPNPLRQNGAGTAASQKSDDAAPAEE